MIIYKITNIINNKKYIGKTKLTLKKRCQRHLSLMRQNKNRYFYDSLRKYGPNNFIVEQIEECKTDLQTNIREKYWIKYFKSNNKKYGYNLTLGGDGGKTMSSDWYKKQGEKRKGIKLSMETREKIRISNLGKHRGPMSEEQKQKISQTMLKRGVYPTFIPCLKGKAHPMYGKTHTKEARSRISKSRLGKTYEEIYGIKEAKRIKKLFAARMKNNTYAKTKEPRCLN